MIDLYNLTLVNYCHPDCEPLKNIMRQSKEDAFRMAKELADAHPDTTAFYRFSDFENYYRLREAQDQYLYDQFVAAGGKPETEHPLSFVLEGSGYLAEWFGHGIETRIPVRGIDEKHISFTPGDSGAEYQKNGSVQLLTLHGMEKWLSEQTGDLNGFLKSIGKHYIEVQLWSDIYVSTKGRITGRT